MQLDKCCGVHVCATSHAGLLCRQLMYGAAKVQIAHFGKCFGLGKMCKSPLAPTACHGHVVQLVLWTGIALPA